VRGGANHRDTENTEKTKEMKNEKRRMKNEE
jgi:hypothetical protein